jgi:hypothetical protein
VTVDSDASAWTILLQASTQIEESVATIKRGVEIAFAELRSIDTELVAIGLPTKRPDLLGGEDIDRCLELARDVTTRIRRAVALSMAVEGQGGRA